MSTVHDIAVCFDFSAKRLIAFSDELAENHMREERKWKGELKSEHVGLVMLIHSIPIEPLSLMLFHLLKVRRPTIAMTRRPLFTWMLFLKFDFFFALYLRNIWLTSSTVVLANYLQTFDINLLEAVTESKIVIRRLTDERNDVHVWEALFDKAYEIAAEYDIEACCRTSKRQRKLSCRKPIWLQENIILPCFHGSFSGRDIIASSKQRGAFSRHLIETLQINN